MKKIINRNNVGIAGTITCCLNMRLTTRIVGNRRITYCVNCGAVHKSEPI